MKSNKIRKRIMIFSLITLLITVIISYFIEAQSQKLPAVVKTNKVLISSETSGIVKKYAISLMDEVVSKNLILKLENPKLNTRLKVLQKEKQRVEELITSAQTGDHLKMELFKLDEDILKNENNLRKKQLQKENITDKIAIYTQKYNNSNLQYEAQKELYVQGHINSAEFQKKTDDFLNISNKYNELQSNFLQSEKEIETFQNLINILNAQKKLLSNNVSLLADRYLNKINEINSKISEIEENIKNLEIYAPTAGTVTDIYYKTGEKIKSGDVIAEIATINKIWIIAFGNSFSRRRIKKEQKVKIFCANGKKIYGKVTSVSPIMEKVKALSSSFETANTYSKIEISFDDEKFAHQNLTPGERLTVRIFYK
ncbi:MAG: HlyD family efflux transporter periplasmic adaptor subunit [Candidatus Cloacimonetes bacterium]|nr:HlyD family efflux transporter periplasmic adaptor subunit [Candidatus Cloacimonadota bacterium]